jgi:hypothetical protein
MSRIVNGRISKIGKPMISNSIFSYPAYRAVYDLAYPVFTNIALGIDSIRFFFICYLPVGGTKGLDRFAFKKCWVLLFSIFSPFSSNKS